MEFAGRGCLLNSDSKPAAAIEVVARNPNLLG